MFLQHITYLTLFVMILDPGKVLSGQVLWRLCFSRSALKANTPSLVVSLLNSIGLSITLTTWSKLVLPYEPIVTGWPDWHYINLMDGSKISIWILKKKAERCLWEIFFDKNNFVYFLHKYINPTKISWRRRATPYLRKSALKLQISNFSKSIWFPHSYHSIHKDYQLNIE